MLEIYSFLTFATRLRRDHRMETIAAPEHIRDEGCAGSKRSVSSTQFTAAHEVRPPAPYHTHVLREGHHEGSRRLFLIRFWSPIERDARRM